MPGSTGSPASPRPNALQASQLTGGTEFRTVWTLRALTFLLPLLSFPRQICPTLGLSPAHIPLALANFHGCQGSGLPFTLSLSNFSHSPASLSAAPTPSGGCMGNPTLAVAEVRTRRPEAGARTRPGQERLGPLPQRAHAGRAVPRPPAHSSLCPWSHQWQQ